ncbi:WAS protein family like protein 1 [Dufourea novaeangliae]|uniref:WAS protein family like protein 1 n=1 Tax=Dufourea novaeangliae TaxID=178035 RepID=A0A154PQ80_DUFNO|nr:WAS protein family like protein 1 [Dufourea novaeangliae]
MIVHLGVIPDNLRHEETIVQIAEALDDLNFSVSYIFDCIDKRLHENSERLSTIRNRATKVQDQLQYLQTNLNLKAVKMYSAAKYPACHTYKEYKMAIPPNYKDTHEIPKTYKCSVPIKEVPETYLPSNCKTEDAQHGANNNLQEKLQFYHVRSKTSKEVYTDSNELTFPLHLYSISALLFDSMDNPYKILTKQTGHRANESQQIEDAPDSIIQPWLTSEMDWSSSYLYTPTLGEVPQINVPPTLPDLPGIVDDEKFVLDLNSQSPIAPSSAVTTPTVRLDLPTPTSTADEKDLNRKLKQNMLNLPGFIDTDSSKHSTQDATILVPPPPPPPPISETYTTTTRKDSKNKRITGVKNKSTNLDDRSNLMAAIRDAGGIERAKLRHTVPPEEKGNRWSSASVGGDLMADLHAKLALRRKGIAGTGGNALERMSSLIPPPPKPNEASTWDRNSATSECDSQPDTDDWDE